MIIKLPKRPDSIFNNEHLFNYLLELERTQKLETLPDNLMVYYVFSTFANEVLNGGLMQYFKNTSKLTYVYLRQCGNLLNHDGFSPFISRMCDYFDSIIPIKFDSGVEQEVAIQIDSFDKEFYGLDEKFDSLKIIEKFYKNNFSVEKIEVPKIKEQKNSSCRYFVIPDELICSELKEAIDSFLKVLSDFSA